MLISELILEWGNEYMLETVSKNIILLIRNNNLSINNFAKKIGYTQPAVSRWIKMDKYPSIQAIESICNTFDVSADWLLFGKEV